MTGYASGQGAGCEARWRWEIRAVNGKGLDLRFRLPDWIDGLEAALRKAFEGRVARGSVTVSLRVHADPQEADRSLDDAALDRALKAISRIEAQATVAGVALAPTSAAEIAALRGVWDGGEAAGPDPDALRAALLESFPPVMEAFVDMRATEGAALARILTAQLDEIAELAATARQAAEARAPGQKARLEMLVSRVLDTTEAVDPDRLAQELALIAVKADVTEELDRLDAHVAAARDLLAEPGAVGRKLDFLMQEFNREANTLCAKAQSSELTQTGLALKTVIDRMREQVQNVE